MIEYIRSLSQREIPVQVGLSFQDVAIQNDEYNRLSLSRIPRDALKHFEISVPLQIRFAELRKTLNRTTTFNKMNM